MGPKWFKVPSKWLLISWICWFSIIKKMMGFLETPHAQTTDNDNSVTKSYFCLSLLANLTDILWPVDARSIILGIFDLTLYYKDPFSPSLDGIPLDALDDCSEKPTFLNCDSFLTPSETRHSWNSESDSPLMAGIYCTCGLDFSWLLFSEVMFRSCLGVFLGSSSRYWVNQLSLRSIFSISPLCDLYCTRSVQFGVIVPSLMNINVDN